MLILGDEDLCTAFRNNTHLLPSVPAKTSYQKVAKDVPTSDAPVTSSIMLIFFLLIFFFTFSAPK